MQGSVDHSDPSPNRYTYITVPASVAQGILWKRGWEDCKSQNNRKAAFPRNGCVNKTGIMTIPMTMIMSKGNFHGLPKQRTTDN